MEVSRLGEILINEHGLRSEDLERALAEQRRAGGKLGEILIRLNLVTEAQVTESLATQLNVATARLDPLPHVPPAVLARIPATMAHAWLVLPLECREDEKTLIVATSELLKGQRLEELRARSRCWIVPKLASRSALTHAISALYGPSPTQAARKSPEPTLRAVVPTPSRLASLPLPTPPSPDLQALGPHAQLTHPEVRALVKLLLDKGLVSPSEVHSTFKDVLSRSSSHQNQLEVE